MKNALATWTRSAKGMFQRRKESNPTNDLTRTMGLVFLVATAGCCQLGQQSAGNFRLGGERNSALKTGLSDRPDSSFGVLLAWAKAGLPGARVQWTCELLSQGLRSNGSQNSSFQVPGKHVSDLYAEELVASKLWPAMVACDSLFRFRCESREAQTRGEFTLAMEATEFVSMSEQFVQWIESGRLPIGDATSVLAYMRLVQSRAAEKAVADPDSAWSDFTALESLPRLAITPVAGQPLHTSVLLPEDYMGAVPGISSPYVLGFRRSNGYANLYLDLQEGRLTSGGGFGEGELEVTIPRQQFLALNFIPTTIVKVGAFTVTVAGVDPFLARGAFVEVAFDRKTGELVGVERLAATPLFTLGNSIHRESNKSRIAVLDSFSGLVELIDFQTWESEILIDAHWDTWLEQVGHVDYGVIRGTEEEPARYGFILATEDRHTTYSLSPEEDLVRLYDLDENGSYEAVQWNIWNPGWFGWYEWTEIEALREKV